VKALFTVMAVIEVGAGLGMLAVPSSVGTILLGSPLNTPVELIIARVTGVALLALAVACWLARDDGKSRAARGLVSAMLLYDAGAVTVLLYAGTGLGLAGVGLWPGVLVHAAIAAWCTIVLFGANHRTSEVRLEK